MNYSLNVLPLRYFTAEFPSLTGVARARQLLAKLIAWTADEAPKGTLIIDFTGIADASASFLREAILAFRDYVRAYQPELFPVLANIAANVREELDTLLKARGEAMPACRIDDAGRAVDADIIGALEASLSQTLAMIRERGPLALSDLPGETKASTWSNRLANLIRQGFIVPIPEANKRVYRYVLA
jgi:hypothetical protein